jgi:hypothetical protein
MQCCQVNIYVHHVSQLYAQMSLNIPSDHTIYNNLQCCNLFVWVTIPYSQTSLLIVFCVIAWLRFHVSSKPSVNARLSGYGKRPEYVNKIGIKPIPDQICQYGPCSSIGTIISICIKKYHLLAARYCEHNATL